MIDRAGQLRARVAADVAGPLCLSAPVLWTFVVLTLAISTTVDAGTHSGRWPWWTLLGALTTGICVALLVLARIALRPWNWQRPRLLLVLFLYAAAGALRSELVLGAAARAGEQVSTPLTLRVIGAALMCLLVLPLASAAVHGAAGHRAALAELASTEQQLLALAATMQVRVATARAELERETREQLTPTMDALRAQLDELHAGQAGEDIAGMLTEAVTNVVRPMSHGLAEREVQALIEEEAPAEDRRPRSVAPIDMVQVIRPVPTALLCLAASLVLAPARGMSGRTVVIIVLVNILVWLMLAGSRRWWPARWRMLPRRHALVVLIMLLTAVMLASREVLGWLQTDSFPLREQAVSVVLRVSLAMVVAVFAIVDVQRRDVEQRLAAQNTELEQLVAALRRELWATKRTLALALHGPLQSTLVSSALLLSRPGITPTDLAAVRDRIEQALSQIEGGGEQTSIELALAETAALWSDSVDVEWALDDTAATRLHQDAGLTAAVAEIVREAVGNAVRHGAATRVDVAITPGVGDLVHVEVRDNGGMRSGGGAPGLGSRVLDEVAYRWERHIGDGGALLEVELR